jgi:excisionase family DNA binding protein
MVLEGKARRAEPATIAVGARERDRSMRPLLTPRQAAELLAVSRSWIYDAASTGRVPCVRLGGPGGPLRFRPEDLEAMVGGNQA